MLPPVMILTLPLRSMTDRSEFTYNWWLGAAIL
jgi:hypothetical protein